MAEQRGQRPYSGVGGSRIQGQGGTGGMNIGCDSSQIKLVRPIAPELFNGIAKDAARAVASADRYSKK
jgi:hypothetical protein